MNLQPNGQAYFTRGDGRLTGHGLILLQRMAEEIERLQAQVDAQAAEIAALDARVTVLEP